jgi:CheY-like chemotaxis protein
MISEKEKSCLLIESDPEDQEIFLDALHSVTYDCGCYAVSNGEEALFTLVEEDFIPDYIFTEISMPRMDGFEFMKILKRIEKFRNVPVIVYTSEFSEDTIQKAEALGAIAVFSKTRVSALKDILRRYFQTKARSIL